MKNLSLFIILLVLILISNSLFCQQDNCIDHIKQFSTGKAKITYYTFDCETNEPLIGVTIYSFDKDSVLATSDIDGISITDKELEGNLEVSYVGYYPMCFKLFDFSIDSVILCLCQDIINRCLYVEDKNGKFAFDSLIQKANDDAKSNLLDYDIKLLTKTLPSEEQISFAKSYSFNFELWEGPSYYREKYNGVVIDYLSEKFKINIEEELRKICWRNHQL